MSKKEDAKKEETKVQLPKGITQEVFDTVKNIIVSGFKADQKPDVIKAAIFEAGVPFSKLNKLYSQITKDKGLVVDPKILGDAIVAALKKFKINPKDTYEQIEKTAASIAEKIDGANEAKVIAAIKKMYKDGEVEFPRKPATARGKMGVINKTIIDVFKKNSKATEEDLEKELAKVTKTLKNANDYAKTYHKMAYALANGLSTLEVLTVFAKEKASEK